MSYSGVGNAIEAMFKLIIWGAIIFVPLGTWKFIEILIWIYSNVQIGLKP